MIVSLNQKFVVFGHALIEKIKHFWFEIAVFSIVAALLLWKARSFAFLGDGTTSGTVLTASVIVYGFTFVLAEYLLRRQGAGFERFFIASTCVVSGIWFEKGLYHFGYYTQALKIHDFVGGATTLTFNTTGEFYPLIWTALMISLPLVAYKYMKINKALIITGIVGLTIYLSWISVGYPQFFAPEWFPSTPQWIQWTPKSNSEIVFYGYFFNSLFKVFALMPALLFFKKPKGKMDSSSPFD